MDNECIASWLKSIKEKYLHGGDESLDDTRILAIDTAIKRLEEQQNTIWELQELNEHLNDKLKKSEEQKFIAHEDGTIEPVTKVVRCKDCIHRGDKNRCILAFVADKQNFPLFFYDIRGEWFCADGKRKDGEQE